MSLSLSLLLLVAFFTRSSLSLRLLLVLFRPSLRPSGASGASVASLVLSLSLVGRSFSSGRPRLVRLLLRHVSPSSVSPQRLLLRAGRRGSRLSLVLSLSPRLLLPRPVPRPLLSLGLPRLLLRSLSPSLVPSLLSLIQNKVVIRSRDLL